MRHASQPILSVHISLVLRHLRQSPEPVAGARAATGTGGMAGAGGRVGEREGGRVRLTSGSGGVHRAANLEYNNL